MSVLIKGIDLPKEGEHIIALIKNDGKCSYWKQDTEYGICEPMQTVEAIQIPTPHGRIIDEDEIFEQPHCGECNDATLDAINNAPTILEEEE